MKFTMSEPCKHCPFRTDIKGYLTKERVVGIAESVMSGQTFPCHKTTVAIERDDDEDDDGGMTTTENFQECAGAAIFAAKQGASSQMSRIAERLGMKVAKLDLSANVCDTVGEMVEVHCGKQKGGTCCVTGDDCLAPAGYACGGGVREGTDFVTTKCHHCGDYVCTGCSKIIKRRRVCDNCEEEHY